MLAPSMLAYFPGIMNPHEAIPIKITGIPKKEKRMMNEVSTRHRLGWYGKPDNPVLYQASNPSVENVEKFHTEILNFFEEVGYAEI